MLLLQVNVNYFAVHLMAEGLFIRRIIMIPFISPSGFFINQIGLDLISWNPNVELLFKI